MQASSTMDENQEESAPATQFVPWTQPSSEPKEKKPARRALREWRWTDEMELDLLHFAWGKGTNMNDYYPSIVKRFAKVYNIHTTEHEIRKRFARLRIVQKRLLTKYGRPLPPPSKYNTKKKKQQQVQAKQTVEASEEDFEGEIENDGDDAYYQQPRGKKRVVQELESESVSPPVLSHQNDIHATIPVDLFLAAARELERRQQAEVE